VGPIVKGVVIHSEDFTRRITVNALFDTGTNSTGVSRRVTSMLAPFQTSVVAITTALGTTENTLRYTAVVDLPNAGQPIPVLVFEGGSFGRYDALLGRDVLRTGTFHLEEDWFSFCQKSPMSDPSCAGLGNDSQ